MTDTDMPPDTPTRTDRLDELATEHATLLSLIGADISESGEVIDTLSRNAAAANRSSTETVECAETARASARAARNDIRDARGAATAARDQLATLQRTVGEIDEITGILEEIADQTNMLALNASIEAARVGGEGDGFAVVADEIKALAEQAQQQATEIETIVEQVQSDAEDTIEQIASVDEKTDGAAGSIADTVNDLDEIADSAVETSDSVDEVADTTQQFADDVDDLATKVIDAIEQASELDELSGGLD